MRKTTPEEYLLHCINKGLDLPIDTYINSRTPIHYKCINNHVYLQQPNNHESHGCSVCNNVRLHSGTNLKWSMEKMYNYCKDNDLDLPLLNQDYTNNKDAYTYVCPKHGNYEQSWDKHLQGRGCPVCNKSRGEYMVQSILDELGIKYECQKTFDNLVDVRKLSYDFYLPDYNTLIEYQGIQHYLPKTFGGITKEQALDNFHKQQYHDKLKRDYASNNNYNLIEVNSNNINKLPVILKGLVK